MCCTKIQLDLEEATTPPPHVPTGNQLCFIYRMSKGVLPLQSITAHFMGPKTTVKVHEGWSEPVIVCGVVMAHKGQQKSPALGYFHRKLSKMEQNLVAENESDEKQPQTFVEHFANFIT